MIRVLVVDDHAIVRRGLRQILQSATGLYVIGEATTGGEALAKIRDSAWDVVVLDMSLPDRSGLDVLKQVKTEYPGLPVLVLTVHSEQQYGLRVLKAGGAGYLTKDAAPEELTRAIQRVTQGKRYLSPAMADSLAAHIGIDPDTPPHESLSDREFQVLCLMAKGKSLTEIAKDLFVSVKTIGTHRARILQKMRLRNNAELIQYALRNGLID